MNVPIPVPKPHRAAAWRYADSLPHFDERMTACYHIRAHTTELARDAANPKVRPPEMDADRQRKIRAQVERLLAFG